MRKGLLGEIWSCSHWRRTHIWRFSGRLWISSEQTEAGNTAPRAFWAPSPYGNNHAAGSPCVLDFDNRLTHFILLIDYNLRINVLLIFFIRSGPLALCEPYNTSNYAFDCPQRTNSYHIYQFGLNCNLREGRLEKFLARRCVSMVSDTLYTLFVHLEE